MRRIAAAICSLLVVTACGGPGRGPYGDLGQATTVCPAGSTVAGLDVSDNQGAIQWSSVASDETNNIKFAYAKATEGGNTLGTAYFDTEFSTNWPAMKTAGLIRGAYHYFHSADDGTAQADNFLEAVTNAGGFAAGDLPPVLDWEITDDDSSSSQADTNAQAFVAEIYAQTGRQTVVYTDFGFFDGLTGTSSFGSDALWVADWFCTDGCSGMPAANACPDVDSPWAGWQFWQWSDSGTVQGVSGADLDVFNGSLTQLQQYAAGFSPPAQVTGNDSVTLVNWPDKHLELFARTPAGQEMHTATTGNNDTWGAPAALDSGAECGSAAAFQGPPSSAPEVFSPLTGGGSGYLSWSEANGWATYADFAGEMNLAHFATTVGNDGRVWVFALGPDAAIRVQSWSSSAWSGWTSLGGTFATGAGPITWGDGTIEIFATDASGTVWHNYLETSASGWAGWASLGNGMASRPVPVRWDDGSDGHAEIFVRGADDQLYEQEFSYTNGWPATFTVLSAGTSIAGEPSAVMIPGVGPEVFARDGTGHVMSLANVGGEYMGFVAMGDQLVASDPFGWVRGNGAPEVFAIDGSGQLVRDYDDPTNGWTGWSSLGSGFDPCNGVVTETDAGTEVDAGVQRADAGVFFPTDDIQPPRETGCGCTAGGGSGLALVMVLALFLRQRRWRMPGV